ncbi:hypothetical protein [Hugenholtzia roseola]|uniref:hypothetical protein n=1 Tax=Hugenholtzia roseola TaxID=1002 RepID=UPI00040C32AE|nr:hypothetical protein [Hugenholtzia roseola]
MENASSREHFYTLYNKLIHLVLPFLSPLEAEKAKPLAKKIVFEILYQKANLFEEMSETEWKNKVEAIPDLEWFRLIFSCLPEKKENAAFYLKTLLQLKNYDLEQLSAVCDAPREWVLEVLMQLFELPKTEM